MLCIGIMSQCQKVLCDLMHALLLFLQGSLCGPTMFSEHLSLFVPFSHPGLHGLLQQGLPKSSQHVLSEAEGTMDKDLTLTILRPKFKAEDSFQPCA